MNGHHVNARGRGSLGVEENETTSMSKPLPQKTRLVMATTLIALIVLVVVFAIWG